MNKDKMGNNICAVVIQTEPKEVESVLENIEKMQICDIHFYNMEGKIIVTLESENPQKQIETINIFQTIHNVIHVGIHFIYSDNLNI